MGVQLYTIRGDVMRLPVGKVFRGALPSEPLPGVQFDEAGQVLVVSNCLLAKGLNGKNVLFDAGPGMFLPPERRVALGILGETSLLVSSLKRRGVQPEDIDVVVLSRLTLGCAGGILTPDEQALHGFGRLFPNAHYIVSRDAYEVNQRGGGNGDIQDIAHLLQQSKDGKRQRCLHILNKGEETSALLGDQVIFHRTGGQGWGQLHPQIITEQGILLLGGDLIPGRAWLAPESFLGHVAERDQAIGEKRWLLDQAIAGGWTLFFSRDAGCSSALIARGQDGHLTTVREKGGVAWRGDPWSVEKFSGSSRSFDWVHVSGMGWNRHQEDYVFTKKGTLPLELIAVNTDGHGKGTTGRLSKYVTGRFVHHVERLLGDDCEDPETALREAVHTADSDLCQLIIDLRASRAKPSDYGLDGPPYDGGVMLEALVHFKGRSYLVHVGDTGAYLVDTASETAKQLTFDQNEGLIPSPMMRGFQALGYPDEKASRDSIISPVIIDLGVLPRASCIILVSDGLLQLTLDFIRGLATWNSVDDTADRLMLAMQPAAWDNVSAQVLKKH